MAAMAVQQLLHFGDVLSTGVLIDWAYLGFLFKQISPYFFACLGISLAVGLSIAGAAWCACPWLYCIQLSTRSCMPGPAVTVSATGQNVPRVRLTPLTLCRGIFITGSSLLGAAIRVPRITSKNLIRCAPACAAAALRGHVKHRRLACPCCDAHAVLRQRARGSQHHLLRGRRYLRRNRGHHSVDALGEPVRRARRADGPVPHPGDDRRLCHLRLGHHDWVEQPGLRVRPRACLPLQRWRVCRAGAEDGLQAELLKQRLRSSLF